MERRLAAILAADVADYSRLMGEDQAGTLDALRQLRKELFEPAVEDHRGNVVKRLGDGWIVEFASILDTANCAKRVQAGLAGNEIIRLRAGIHIGEVVFEEEDVFGDGVNVAARLQVLAEPGEVLISDTARNSLDAKTADQFSGGEAHELKNIARPVSVWRWRHEAGPVADVSKSVAGFDGRPAIAVLPFDNMSGDPEQEYFADGIAEDILTRLAMWWWLPVIARNSSFTFKGQKIDVMEVGRALGARYILEGSVRKVGNRVRVSGQLIDAESGHHLWVERYDRDLEDIFALQDEITEAIVVALEPAVGRAERKRAQQLTYADLGAWDTTQRAVWHLNKFTKDDFAVSHDMLRAVIAGKPDLTYALSYAAMIRVLQALFAWTDDPAAALTDAHGFATAAVSNDPMDPLANTVRGFMLAFQGRHSAAIGTARRAIELNPRFAIGYHMLGVTYMFDGQPQEAIAAVEQAIRLSPFDNLRPMWLATLSASHYLARDYGRALEVADSAVQVAPHYPLGLRGRANALAQLGRLDEAREALDAFLKVSPNYTVASGRAGAPFREEAVFQHYMDGLRKAGLPEE